MCSNRGSSSGASNPCSHHSSSNVGATLVFFGRSAAAQGARLSSRTMRMNPRTSGVGAFEMEGSRRCHQFQAPPLRFVSTSTTHVRADGQVSLELEVLHGKRMKEVGSRISVRGDRRAVAGGRHRHRLHRVPVRLTVRLTVCHAPHDAHLARRRAAHQTEVLGRPMCHDGGRCLVFGCHLADGSV